MTTQAGILETVDGLKQEVADLKKTVEALTEKCRGSFLDIADAYDAYNATFELIDTKFDSIAKAGSDAFGLVDKKFNALADFVDNTNADLDALDIAIIRVLDCLEEAGLVENVTKKEEVA